MLRLPAHLDRATACHHRNSVHVAAYQQTYRLRQRQAQQSCAACVRCSATGSQWQHAVDPSSGRTYYWHTATRETSWEAPAETATSGAAAPDADYEGSAADTSSDVVMLQTLRAALVQDGSGMLFNEKARSLRSSGVFTDRYFDYVMHLAVSADSEDERLMLQRIVARLSNPLLRQAAPYE